MLTTLKYHLDNDKEVMNLLVGLVRVLLISFSGSCWLVVVLSAAAAAARFVVSYCSPLHHLLYHQY